MPGWDSQNNASISSGQAVTGGCIAAQVFAPLARLLGLYSIKEELEALSFRYSHPEEHALVQRRLDCLAKDQEDVVLKVRLA